MDVRRSNSTKRDEEEMRNLILAVALTLLPATVFAGQCGVQQIRGGCVQQVQAQKVQQLNQNVYGQQQFLKQQQQFLKQQQLFSKTQQQIQQLKAQQLNAKKQRAALNKQVVEFRRPVRETEFVEVPGLRIREGFDPSRGAQLRQSNRDFFLNRARQINVERQIR